MDRSYSAQAVSEAVHLLHDLLMKGHVRDQVLMRSYLASPDVRDLLTNQFVPAFDAAMVEYSGNLHLFPSPGNRVLGPSADQLRERLHLKGADASELNLSLFIMVAIVALLQGDGAGVRHFITVTEVIRYVTERLDSMRSRPDLAEAEETLALDIRGMADFWFSMHETDHRHASRTQGHQEGRVHRVLGFWEKEGLISLTDDERIFAEERLHAAYLLFRDQDRREELLQQLREPDAGERVVRGEPFNGNQ